MAITLKLNKNATAGILDRTEVDGSRKTRVYDKSATPFESLKTSGQADPKKIECLERVRVKLNPFKLKKTIERKLRRVLQLRHAPQAWGGLAQEIAQLQNGPFPIALLAPCRGPF